MKITRIIGDMTIVFEGTIEEWRAFNGAKPEWKPWMDKFYPTEGIGAAFKWPDTDEGLYWWINNYHTPSGLNRFEEMKREYKAWKDANQ